MKSVEKKNKNKLIFSIIFIILLVAVLNAIFSTLNETTKSDTSTKATNNQQSRAQELTPLEKFKAETRARFESFNINYSSENKEIGILGPAAHRPGTIKFFVKDKTVNNNEYDFFLIGEDTAIIARPCLFDKKEIQYCVPLEDIKDKFGNEHFVAIITLPKGIDIIQREDIVY